MIPQNQSNVIEKPNCKSQQGDKLAVVEILYDIKRDYYPNEQTDNSECRRFNRYRVDVEQIDGWK